MMRRLMLAAVMVFVLTGLPGLGGLREEIGGLCGRVFAGSNSPGLDAALERARNGDYRAWREIAAFGNDAVDPIAAMLADDALASLYAPAINALGCIGTSEAESVLMAALDSENFLQRMMAAQALGRLGAEAARVKLAAMAKEDSYSYKEAETGEMIYMVRLEAEEALRTMDRTLPPAALARFGAEIKWRACVKDALAESARENKPVLAVVRLAQESPGDAATLLHACMMASLFSGSELADLVNARFIPVQVSFTVEDAMRSLGQPAREDDPLRALGVDCSSIKPAALLAATPEGKRLGLLNGMATFDAEAVYRFVLQCASEAGGSSGADNETFAECFASGDLQQCEKLLGEFDEPERCYWQGRMMLLRGDWEAAAVALEKVDAASKWRGPALARRGYALMKGGEFEEARRILTDAWQMDLHGERPFAAYWLGRLCLYSGEWDAAQKTLGRLREEYPDHVFARKADLLMRHSAPALADMESMRAPPGDVNGGSEVAVKREDAKAWVKSSIDFLLRRQRKDGAWVGAEPNSLVQDNYSMTYTALVLMAFAEWKPRMDEGLRAAMDASTERGVRALLDMMKRLNSRSGTFDLCYALQFWLRRHKAQPSDESAQAVGTLVDALSRAQYDDGAWGYQGGAQGRSHSFNTSHALYVLGQALLQKFEVSDAVLEKGTDALVAMRGENGAWQYGPSPGLSWMTQSSMSIARAPLCEAALARLDNGDEDLLLQTLDLFVEHQAQLREPVKVFTGSFTQHGHGSYFYYYAYHCAITAAKAAGRAGKPYLEKFYDGILSHAEFDGTWVDHYGFGKVYATAMAVLALGELENAR